MQKQAKPTVSVKNLKRRLSMDVTISEPKAIKTATTEPSSPRKPASPIKQNKKKLIPIKSEKKKPDTGLSSKSKIIKKKKKTKETATSTKLIKIDDIGDTLTNIYPILKNDDLVKRFRSVPMSNNQKGRIRQALKCQLLDSENNISADLIHGKIQAILKSADDLKDSDLRKIRILYNMLQTASHTVPSVDKKVTETKTEPKVKKEEKEENKKGKDTNIPKKKGPKRYVVFLGNLPLSVTKERLMQHFAEINTNIKDIRIPQQADKKSAIAFMEVANKSTYEVALSKHHSMLDNKRINVSFTLQENSKLTKSEAKGKAAKLVALQKAGKLAGSTALVKKRSHRRNIMKRAKAKVVAAENA